MSRYRYALLLAFVSTNMLSTAIARIDPPYADSADDGVPMILELSLNGTRMHELLRVERTSSGAFSVKADDLARLRIKLDKTIKPDEMVRLDSLEGVVVEYNEAKQALTLQVPDHLLEAYVVNLYGQAKQDSVVTTKPLAAAILNYGLYHTYQRGQSLVSGNAELLLTGRAGVFSNTAFYNQTRARYGLDKTVRLDSRWQHIDPVAVRSYVLGDFVSNTMSWGSSVRLAGFQWASAFDQRSDIVTAALPAFSGSAALPSTLDLYVNQQRVYSGEIPAGPFDLQSLPLVSGNQVTLVTTDATGRQTTQTQNYYYSARLLQPGIKQFSVDVGVPRLFYGLKSNDYDSVVFASGSIRYGLTNTKTIETHAESTGDGLFNLGIGLAQSVRGRGVVSGALSTSRYKGYSGTRLALGTEGQLAGLRLYASTDRSYGDYFNLARVSGWRLAQQRNVHAANGSRTWLMQTGPAKAIDRIGLGFTLFERSSVNLNYNRIQYPRGQVRTGSVSLSYNLSPRFSLQANAYTDMARRGSYGVYLSLNMALNNINASTSVGRDAKRSRYTQQVSSSSGQRQGDMNWGLVNMVEPGAMDSRGAYLSYRARQTLLSASVHQFGGSTRTELQATGSLLTAAGGVFAANRVGDAYAIITNAGPNVELLQGGVEMGRTDRNGRALLANLRPYIEQRVHIDPSTLPSNWEPQLTEQRITARYRQGVVVDFGARVVHGAVVLVQDKHGKPVAPGHTVRLNGTDNAVLGYDGEVYLRGLSETNQIHIDMGLEGECSVQFTYVLSEVLQPRIGPVICQ